MPTVPPTRCGMKVRFKTPYRGGDKIWQQSWHWDGPTTWADQTQVNAFFTAWKAQIQGLLPARTHFVDATFYNAGSFLPVFTVVDTAAGSSTVSGVPQAPLEAAMLARFTTDARSVKNHPIYLFKWFHGVWTAGDTSPDSPPAGAVTNMNSNLNTILAGLSDGTNTRKYCGPRGAVAQARLVEPYLHMREFPT